MMTQTISIGSKVLEVLFFVFLGDWKSLPRGVGSDAVLGVVSIIFVVVSSIVIVTINVRITCKNTANGIPSSKRCEFPLLIEVGVE
jgi:hypothetical protein